MTRDTKTAHGFGRASMALKLAMASLEHYSRNVTVHSDPIALRNAMLKVAGHIRDTIKEIAPELLSKEGV